MEHRVHVGLGGIERASGLEWAGIVVDELQLLALVDRRDAALRAGCVEIAGVEHEPGDRDRVPEAFGELTGVGAGDRIGASVVVVLGQVAVGDVAAFVEPVGERVDPALADAVLPVPRLPNHHDPH